MTDKKATRLSKIAREFNVGISTIVDFLHKKGHEVEANPNTKIPAELYDILVDEYSSDINLKRESEKLSLHSLRDKKETISINDIPEEERTGEESEDEVLVKDPSGIVTASEKEEKETAEKEEKKAEEEKEKEKEKEPSLKVVGHIDLKDVDRKKKAEEKEKKEEKEKEKKEKEPAAKDKKEEAEAKRAEKEAEKTEEQAEEQPEEEEEENFIQRDVQKLTGPTVVGKIDLPREAERKTSETKGKTGEKKKRRKRIKKDLERIDLSEREQEKRGKKGQKGKKKSAKPEVSEEDVQKQVKDTLARLTQKGKSKASRYRREKRDAISQRMQEETEKKEAEKSILKVTEFVSVNELANMMDVPANEVIAKCMDLGLFVSINQRLDAETMSLIAEEYNYKVEFVSADEVEEEEEVVEEDPTNLLDRPPIVTVMGHVDHGKTKLLDYIRNTNVIAGEAGGITQHIGAYNVTLDGGRKITFLDTPGHEAFTAMRARGAQVTDLVIIVVAADDGVKPQTKEAINHAQAAGVPIVFAINKIDKPTANPDKVKEELANMNILVEDWGGKYQSQEISAKNGININDLLEKVLLEAELLELKANPDRQATGTVIESTLDRGRGYVATVLVENGTLRTGDIMLAGIHYGHVKAMYNERNQPIEEAGPATPVLMLGLDGAPQAGDTFKVMESDREAREIATKREQLIREQGLRTQKHITLDEIGRRIAIGNFQELNVIVKGDVDGSIEALSDALIKLSTEEIQINIKHKAVGAISESDVLLAAASNAIIIGFQVRPTASARKLAEKEEIDIRLYSIIYDAIDEIRAAMEGMLSPEIKEEITGAAEVQEVFKISKVGTIAGCIVKEGKIHNDCKLRLIRDGIVVYTGELSSLKRFKDDAKEVAAGQECGIGIENFNDIKTGDIIEAFRETEIKKKL